MGTKLKRLRISNFRSFLGDHELDFPESGLILLKGESGVGKSSVFHAIAYCLGFSPIPAKDLQNWSEQSGPMSVTMLLEHNGQPVEITRTSKNSYIKIGGQMVSTSNKDFEKNLDKHLGTTSGFREILTYRDQMAPVRFTKLSDSEKKALLSDLLGLVKIEQALIEASQEANRLLAEKEKVGAVLSGMEQVLGPEPAPPPLDRMEAINLELKELDRLEENERAEYDIRTKTNTSQYNKDLEDLKYLLTMVPQVQDPRDPVVEQSYRALIEQEAQRLKAWDEILAKHRAKTKGLELQFKAWEAAEREICSVEKSIRDLHVDRCPTCSQEWDSTQHRALLETKLQNLRLSQPPNPSDELKACEYERIAIEATKPSMAEEIAEARLLVKEQESRFLEKQQNRNSKIDSIKAQIATLTANWKSNQKPFQFSRINEVAALRQEQDRLSKDISLRDAAKKSWELSLAKIKAQRQILDDVQQKLAVEQDWQALLRGFLGRIVEEVLWEISSKANDILKNLPNTSSVTVEFQVQKASGKEAITPIFRFGGQEASLKSGASGGMATAIELAIDLALAETVASRKGISMGWLLLDEAFNGFSQGVREEVLTVLGSYARDRLVVAIDHAGEMQAMFSTSIEIKNGGFHWSE